MKQRMTVSVRDMLIEHIDGPVQYRAHGGPSNRRNIIGSAIANNFLRFERLLKHPTHTVLTLKGREELCAVLGDWADAIVRSRIHFAVISNKGLPIASRSSLADKPREVAEPKNLDEVGKLRVA